MNDQYPEDFGSIIELMDYFNTEEKCIKYHQHRRWGSNTCCPRCDHEKVYSFSDGKTFKCAKCRKQFNVRTGTIFEDSKISLRKWFIAIYLITSHKKGISSHQLGRDINVTQKTAWFMLHRIRFQLGMDNDPDEIIEGVVEVDETFIGGKNKNRHKDKKVEKCQGRSFKDKTPVLGLFNRSTGRVKTFAISNTRGATIKPILFRIVRKGSVIISDEWQAYRGIDKYYDHYYVNHASKQYADGDIYTNNIEGFWTWIKRMIMGVYHNISRKHIQSYANEATFRFNSRSVNKGFGLSFMLSSFSPGKLGYKSLIFGL